MVLDPKAELQQVKDAGQVAREASETTETTSYKRGVQETEAWLAEEVVGVCKDYYTEVWAEALNRARVPTDFELRKAKNTFFPKDIREVPTMLSPSVANPLLPPNVEVLIRASKGKEVQPPIKANRFEDALTIRDVVSKAKDAESKSKAGDIQLKAADSKEDPHKAKA